MTKEEYDYLVKSLRKKRVILLLKRMFDILVSFIMILALSPVILILSILIMIDSGFPVFFRQERMGKNGKTFRIFKFRTMKNNTATADGITLYNDKRITRIGEFLRKYRLDEIPQLFNIIKGEMSFVGPRPDLPKYYMVDDYGYKSVLLVRPGVTGEATLKFKDEDKILSTSENPEKTYTEEIFPQKVRLNIDYIKRISILYDMKIIINTVINVFFRKEKDEITRQVYKSNV
jgi:lipopolysaccharide/colanic/teichoic acid biosynthesis glycosyltransferase